MTKKYLILAIFMVVLALRITAKATSWAKIEPSTAVTWTKISIMETNWIKIEPNPIFYTQKTSNAQVFSDYFENPSYSSGLSGNGWNIRKGSPYAIKDAENSPHPAGNSELTSPNEMIIYQSAYAEYSTIRVWVRISSNQGYFGIYFHSKPDWCNYAGWYSPNSLADGSKAQWRIEISYATTTYATDEWPLNLNQIYKVDVVSNHTNVKLYVDEELLLDVTDNYLEETAGWEYQSGLRSRYDNIFWDDYEIFEKNNVLDPTYTDIFYWTKETPKSATWTNIAKTTTTWTRQ